MKTITHLSIGKATPLIAFAPSLERKRITFATSTAVMDDFAGVGEDVEVEMTGWLCSSQTGLKAAKAAASKVGDAVTAAVRGVSIAVRSHTLE
jgi:hypothetical protein